MKNLIKNTILVLILFVSFTLIFTVNWLYNTFGNLTLQEIVFNIKVPIQGTNKDFYFDYIENALIYIVLSTVVAFIALSLLFKKWKKSSPKAKRMKEETDVILLKKHKLDFRFIAKLVISFIVLVISVNYAINETNLEEYISYQLSDSDLIENEYKDPRDVKMEFPEEKRNLIYIYLESMESTYFSTNNGGAYSQSIAPELEQLALENISFSNSYNLKGAYTLPGTTWTSGAMVAQSAGLPLKIAVDDNGYGEYVSFLPGAYTIGQILQTQGYNQMLMVGSDADFGGRKNFYTQHGNYQIFDLNTAIAEGRMKEKDKVWWGFCDARLFEYAQEKITELAEKEEPFNFTMLTADTHHPNGYLCANCRQKEFEEQYFNVIACSSRQVTSFVKWIQSQDFYKDTTIVISGDHLSMQKGLFTNIENSGYERTTMNIFINSAITTESTKYKGVSTIDMFPTTLASLGVNIEGERLGLGTNLFSNKETIVKKYGIKTVTEEFNKSSRFYNKHFIY